MSVYFCEEQRSTDDESLDRQQSGCKVMTKTDIPLGIMQGVEWKQRVWKQCCSIQDPVLVLHYNSDLSTVKFMSILSAIAQNLVVATSEYSV
jgi:hypothetical protein